MEIHLSTAAREAVTRDLDPRQMLRIAFAGGCGAMGFRLSATRRSVEDDVQLDLGALTVLLDRMAAQELDGATLDYEEEEGFFLDHPQWGVSC